MDYRIRTCSKSCTRRRTNANGTKLPRKRCKTNVFGDSSKRLSSSLDWPCLSPISQQQAAEVLPHVYSSTSMSQGAVLSQFGSKYMLPIGTTRHDYEARMHILLQYKHNWHLCQDFEEVILPPAKPVPPKASERLISVSELDPLAKGSFPVNISPSPYRFKCWWQNKGYTSLNRIQSIVYPTAYGTNENMLVCGQSVYLLVVV